MNFNKIIYEIGPLFSNDCENFWFCPPLKKLWMARVIVKKLLNGEINKNQILQIFDYFRDNEQESQKILKEIMFQLLIQSPLTHRQKLQSISHRNQGDISTIIDMIFQNISDSKDHSNTNKNENENEKRNKNKNNKRNNKNNENNFTNCNSKNKYANKNSNYINTDDELITQESNSNNHSRHQIQEQQQVNVMDHQNQLFTEEKLIQTLQNQQQTDQELQSKLTIKRESDEQSLEKNDIENRNNNQKMVHGKDLSLNSYQETPLNLESNMQLVKQNNLSFEQKFDLNKYGFNEIAILFAAFQQQYQITINQNFQFQEVEQKQSNQNIPQNNTSIAKKFYSCTFQLDGENLFSAKGDSKKEAQKSVCKQILQLYFPTIFQRLLIYQQSSQSLQNFSIFNSENGQSGQTLQQYQQQQQQQQQEQLQFAERSLLVGPFQQDQNQLQQQQQQQYSKNISYNKQNTDTEKMEIEQLQYNTNEQTKTKNNNNTNYSNTNKNTNTKNNKSHYELDAMPSNQQQKKTFKESNNISLNQILQLDQKQQQLNNNNNNSNNNNNNHTNYQRNMYNINQKDQIEPKEIIQQTNTNENKQIVRDKKHQIMQNEIEVLYKPKIQNDQQLRINQQSPEKSTQQIIQPYSFKSEMIPLENRQPQQLLKIQQKQQEEEGEEEGMELEQYKQKLHPSNAVIPDTEKKIITFNSDSQDSNFHSYQIEKITPIYQQQLLLQSNQQSSYAEKFENQKDKDYLQKNQNKTNTLEVGEKIKQKQSNIESLEIDFQQDILGGSKIRSSKSSNSSNSQRGEFLNQKSIKNYSNNDIFLNNSEVMNNNNQNNYSNGSIIFNNNTQVLAQEISTQAFESNNINQLQPINNQPGSYLNQQQKISIELKSPNSHQQMSQIQREVEDPDKKLIEDVMKEIRLKEDIFQQQMEFISNYQQKSKDLKVYDLTYQQWEQNLKKLKTKQGYAQNKEFLLDAKYIIEISTDFKIAKIPVVKSQSQSQNQSNAFIYKTGFKFVPKDHINNNNMNIQQQKLANFKIMNTHYDQIIVEVVTLLQIIYKAIEIFTDNPEPKFSTLILQIQNSLQENHKKEIQQLNNLFLDMDKLRNRINGQYLTHSLEEDKLIMEKHFREQEELKCQNLKLEEDKKNIFEKNYKLQQSIKQSGQSSKSAIQLED